MPEEYSPDKGRHYETQGSVAVLIVFKNIGHGFFADLLGFGSVKIRENPCPVTVRKRNDRYSTQEEES
jgi:hypothetical protein